MTDATDRAAEVARRERTLMEVCQAHHLTPASSSAWSLLTALESVLDGMPEHDRQVAANALREWLATWPNRYVGSPIYEDGMTYADRIEQGGTDADT